MCWFRNRFEKNEPLKLALILKQIEKIGNTSCLDSDTNLKGQGKNVFILKLNINFVIGFETDIK